MKSDLLAYRKTHWPVNADPTARLWEGPCLQNKSTHDRKGNMFGYENIGVDTGRALTQLQQ